jgi:hypothetical protein
MHSQRLNERESRRERSSQEAGREGGNTDVREEEVNMNLGGEREDSSLMTGENGNLAEEIIPVEANETPKIKESHPKASGISPKSPIPQVPSI